MWNGPELDFTHFDEPQILRPSVSDTQLGWRFPLLVNLDETLNKTKILCHASP